MATIRGAIAGNSGTVTGTGVTFSLTTGWTGAAPQVGNLLVCVCWWGNATEGTVTWSGSGGAWAIHGQQSNSGGAFTTIAATRVLAVGDGDPTFTGSTGARRAWACIAIAPGTGTLSVDAWATDFVASVAANAFTANAATAAGSGEISVILSAAQASANGANAVTYTPATNWTSPAGYSSGYGGGTSSRANLAATAYRTGQGPGAVTPGADTESCAKTLYANLYHVLITETAAPSGLLPQQLMQRRLRQAFRPTTRAVFT